MLLNISQSLNCLYVLFFVFFPFLPSTSSSTSARHKPDFKKYRHLLIYELWSMLWEERPEGKRGLWKQQGCNEIRDRGGSAFGLCSCSR